MNDFEKTIEEVMNELPPPIHYDGADFVAMPEYSSSCDGCAFRDFPSHNGNCVQNDFIEQLYGVGGCGTNKIIYIHNDERGVIEYFTAKTLRRMGVKDKPTIPTNLEDDDATT